MTPCSIIIPTLNEAGNIIPLLSQIEEVTRQAEIAAEVIFVDDGSTDNTREIIFDYNGTLKVELVCRDNQKGLASAVVAGAKAARNDFVVVMDADLSHSPAMIPMLLKPLQEKHADMTLGSRFVEGAEIPGLPYIRTIGSRIATAAARMFTSVSDPLTGFFAVDRQTLCATDVTGNGFKIALEVLAANTHFKVKEIPIIFQDRNSGSSKMSRAVVSAYLAQLCRLGRNRATDSGLNHVILTGILGGGLASLLFFLLNVSGVGTQSSLALGMAIAANASWAAMFYLSKARFPEGAARGYFYFVLTMLLGFFLQNGLLFPLLTENVNSALALSILFLSSVLVLWTALAISIYREYFSWQHHPQRLAILLVVYFFLLRLVFLGGPELIQEEAYYWNYSRHMDTGYLDHPPMVSLLIWFGTTIWGHNEFGVRFGTYLVWMVTAFFAWRFTRLMFNQKTALITLLLLSTMPIFFSVGLISTPDAPLIACWAGSLYFLFRALVQENSSSWYPAGILLGIGLASKYTIAFLAPAIVLFMLLDGKSRKWFFKPQPYLAAILALLFFSPVIWWNYQHDWASFLFQSKDRIVASTEFSTHELLASMLALLTPTGFIAMIAALVKRKELVKGSRSISSKNRSALLFCLCMALVPLSIFTIFSLTKEIKLNWTGPLWLALLPMVAYHMTCMRPDRKGLFMQKAWLSTFVVLGLIYGAGFSFLTSEQPSFLVKTLHYPLNWNKVATQVEHEVAAIAEKEGQRPIVVGTDKYRTASEIAFYRYKNLPKTVRQQAVNETTGRHLFARSSLMYNYWYDPAEAETKNILVVSTDKGSLDGRLYQDRCREMGQIREVILKKNGEDVGSFYYRELKEYKASPRIQLAYYQLNQENTVLQ